MRRPVDLYYQQLNGTMLFQLGPRYWPPVDNTMVMSIRQRTTGGDVSVLLDDEQAGDFAGWIAEGPAKLVTGETSLWTIQNGQTSAAATWVGISDQVDVSQGGVTQYLPGLKMAVLAISIIWNGSRTGRNIQLSEQQAMETAEWIQGAQHNQGHPGWEGWLNPFTMPKYAHNHVKINDVAQPCRICQRIENMKTGKRIVEAIQAHEQGKGD